MPTINANVADYLTQIESLTKTNLQILKTINDSFFTKKSHLISEIDDSKYVIPSFLSLENRINMLQDNFENLVKAPETCEAYFNFDGNTRAIEVRKYSHVPDSVSLPLVNSFNTEQNNIFKDFLTPVPYINLDLPTLPNDIVEVNVKKIVAKSPAAQNMFKSKLEQVETYKDANGNDATRTVYKLSANETYGNIYKILDNLVSNVDYTEYDAVYKLPTIQNIGTGTYVIENVLSDTINEDLEELVTLKINSALTYKLFNDTIEKPLQVGDELLNFDGTGKVVITNISPALNTITVKIVNGEYLNFVGTESYDTNNGTDIHDLSKLRFHMSVDYTSNKYIKVPLEEDQYIFVAVAPINSRMNTQASWGTGIVVNAHGLMNNNNSFLTYYNQNVRNIGDTLFEITSMNSSLLSALPQSTFENLTSFKPSLNVDSLSVMHINKHLNNSVPVENIRNAYAQKKNSEAVLSDIQIKINDINDRLSSITFDDVTGMRDTLTMQLSKLTAQKNELLTAINNSINIITLNANSSEVPIEGAKYRIRGFYKSNESVDGIHINDHVIGIKVQYRYKNVNAHVGNAVSINDGDENFIYSDWNDMLSYNKSKIARCIDGNYSYHFEESNENKNEPSYNQIDIPISQGETVDVRVKLIYDYAYPYIQMQSDWSNIVNVKFPDEFCKDISVLSIIEENNNDIEHNRFTNILTDNGVFTHIGDSVTDQTTIYYHKPDNIASGFYTDERRIIPLKDKLMSMVNDIALLKSELLGHDEACKVFLSVGENNMEVISGTDNILQLTAYNEFITNDNSGATNSFFDGVYSFDKGIVSVMLNLSIQNTSDRAIKLYSVFPGNRNVKLNNASARYAKKSDYCKGNNEGVWFKYKTGTDKCMLQTQNQFITFRINDVWTGVEYYKSNAEPNSKNLQDSTKIDAIGASSTIGMVLYPQVTTKYDLCINSDDAKSYILLNPGEVKTVPLLCTYKVTAQNASIEKTMSFDLRTSLYGDPINYVFTVVAKNNATISDKLHATQNTLNNKNIATVKNGIVYHSTVTK